MDLCQFCCFKGKVSGSKRCPLSPSDEWPSGHPSAKVTWSEIVSPRKRGSSQSRGPLLRSLRLLALSQSLGGQPPVVKHIYSTELFKSWNNNYKTEATHKTGLKKKRKSWAKSVLDCQGIWSEKKSEAHQKSGLGWKQTTQGLFVRGQGCGVSDFLGGQEGHRASEWPYSATGGVSRGWGCR